MTTTRGFLQLTRASLALSPLADQLAGFALARSLTDHEDWRALALSLATSLALFWNGMAGNDLCDREVDRARGNRPIPNGTVTVGFTRCVVGATALVAIGSSAAISATALYLALSILVLITLYNASPSHVGLLGPFVLGSIRALNLTLGAAAVASSIGWLAATYGICIAAIAFVGRMEDGALRPTRLRVIGCVAIAAIALGFVPLAVAEATARPLSPFAFAVAATGILWLASRLAILLRDELVAGPMLARFVGAALATIFFFDATVAASVDDPVICAIVLLMFPCARALVATFPPS